MNEKTKPPNPALGNLKRELQLTLNANSELKKKKAAGIDPIN